MNILYVCADRGIPIRGHKGAAVHVRALADAFARAGHAVTILTPRPGPADGPAPRAELVEVTASDSHGGNGASEHVTCRTYEVAEALHRQRSFDLIYERYSLWSNVGGHLSLRTGIPLVLEVNSPLIEEAQRYRALEDPVRAAAIERFQLARAMVVSVVSHQLRDYAVSRGADSQRVHVLPNGVDPQRFHPAVRGGRVRQALDLHGRTVVGFVGRPRPWHDLKTLLRAMAMLYLEDSRYHLLLVGEMPDDLQGLLEQHGLDRAVTLTGPVAHDDVPEYIAAMDVAVSTHLPLEDFYFSPLKVFEYLACGVPVVAADIGQPAEIIRDGVTGCLYPPGDARTLAGRIRSLIDQPALAREIAWQGAVAVLSTYTWDRNAQRVVELLTPSGEPGLAGNSAAGTGVNGDAPQVPETVGVTEVLPILDDKLRQRLYRATRPDLAAPLLADELDVFSNRGPERLDAVDGIDVLKYKPGRRCVLLYSLRGRDRRSSAPTQHRLIGKVFRDERGQRLHELQHTLWGGNFGPNAADSIHVPEPLGYSPKMRMQLQALAPGVTLNELAGRADLAPLMPRCGQALAKLHTSVRLFLDPDGLPPAMPVSGLTGRPLGMTAGSDQHPMVLDSYLLRDELRNLDIYTSELRDKQPEIGDELQALRSGLDRWAGLLPPLHAVSLVHRDFYYSQLLIDGERVTLIDFDLLALGDPALDVANFTAHLRFLALYRLGDGDALSEEADAFLEAYARYALVDGNFVRRWAFYQAATWFRLMTVTLKRPGLSQHFESLRRRTSESLQGR